MPSVVSPRKKIQVAIVGTDVADIGFPLKQIPPSLLATARDGELYIGRPGDMPQFTDKEYEKFISNGWVRAGGQNNISPQMARAGLTVAGFGALGQGSYDGVDVPGNFIRDVMKANHVDAYHYIFPRIPTGTTFVVPYARKAEDKEDRKGIVYFPNANSLLDPFVVLQDLVTVNPDVAHLVYIGLQEKFDCSLDYFFRTLRNATKSIISADTHTIAGIFRSQKSSGIAQANPHALLATVFNDLDIFFCSSAEAKLIAKANGMKCNEGLQSVTKNDQLYPLLSDFLEELYLTYVRERERRPAVFGLTTADGAFVKTQGREVVFVPSHFLVAHEGLNLVGAGDAWRAGMLAYVARHKDEFEEGNINLKYAAQMGNLMAVLSITAGDDDRYGQVGAYDHMESIVTAGTNFCDRPLEHLVRAVKKAA